MKKQSNFSKLMGYAGNHRFLTYTSWFLSAVSAILALIPFWYIWKIVKEVLEVRPDFSKAENLIHNGWMAVLFAVLTVVTYIAGLLCSHLSAFRVATNIRIKLIRHVAKIPLGELERLGTGSLRRIISETSGATETYLAHQLPDQAKAYATVVGLLVLLFVFDWKLGLLSLLPIVIAFAVMSSMMGNKMKEDMKNYQNALNDMSNEAVEYVRGIPVVKTFGQTVFSFKRFKDAIDRYSKWAIAYTQKARAPMLGYTLAINGAFIVLIIAGLIFTGKGVTDEFLLNIIFYIIITPVITVVMTRLMHAGENNMLLEDSITRIDSVFEISQITSSNNAHPNDSSVKLENVTFSYDGNKNALENISLSVNPGQTVAFVGPSGGGKSTLANIISRFFDPQSGNVLIGGANVKDIPKEELMDIVSFVFQNSKLIKGTIIDNVRMGNPAATEKEVIEALKAAQCIDIIEKFPNGLNTVIGSDGVYLSGGEQQRIAIARAILKDAPIIILDEATAFADPDNENKVQSAFTELAKNRTVIMIAHRLSTVKNADCIYVIKDGQISEDGTFEQLNEKQGLFHDMWNNYQKSIEWRVETI